MGVIEYVDGYLVGGLDGRLYYVTMIRGTLRDPKWLHWYVDEVVIEYV